MVLHGQGKNFDLEASVLRWWLLYGHNVLVLKPVTQAKSVCSNLQNTGNGNAGL